MFRKEIRIFSICVNGSGRAALSLPNHDLQPVWLRFCRTSPPQTQTRTFNYNTNSQLTSAVNPENGTTSHTYNTDGTLYEVTDAKNPKTRYFYDAYLRMSSTKRFNSSGNKYLLDSHQFGRDYFGVGSKEHRSCPAGRTLAIDCMEDGCQLLCKCGRPRSSARLRDAGKTEGAHYA